LEQINGTGKDGRVTKNDILEYVKKSKSSCCSGKTVDTPIAEPVPVAKAPTAQKVAPISVNGGDEIVEMDRMRKLIAGYMVASVQTSAHVQSFIGWM
jgi:2-oxoglutarate dehydrogenase E2 component (dihydrolipoamide succinyltransferase)